MLLSSFQISLAIRNVWPKRMGLKAFFALYILMLLAVMPVSLLSCIPYGLFAIPAAICIYGLLVCPDTASRNVFMGLIGFVLSIVTDNFINILIPMPLYGPPYLFFGIRVISICLFYLITKLCGKLLKKLFLSDKGVLRLPQTWYVIDAAFILLITIFLFDDLIDGQNGSLGRMIYNNVLHIFGYMLVMLFLLLAMRRSYLEKMQAEAKQKALQDLQDYTHNLEAMYNGLRAFKHDYINILLSLSGYIENGSMDDIESDSSG